MNLTFFCEVVDEDLAQYFTEETLTDLLELGAFVRFELVIALTSISMSIRQLSQVRADIVKKLNSVDIPVSAWLLVDKEDGYWANLSNPGAYQKRYEDVLFNLAHLTPSSGCGQKRMICSGRT